MLLRWSVATTRLHVERLSHGQEQILPIFVHLLRIPEDCVIECKRFWHNSYAKLIYMFLLPAM
jgi:hypothetical protein